MSIREDLANNIVETLGEIGTPQPVLITRQPFNVEELAITQFPAIVVQTTTEDRELLTMGSANGRKRGVIRYQIRCFVRGNELDSKRNDLIEAIDEILDGDRYRNKTRSVVMDSTVVSIDIIERQAPLAEFVMNFDVTYNYVMKNN